jgi:hypothetical protein
MSTKTATIRWAFSSNEDDRQRDRDRRDEDDLDGGEERLGDAERHELPVAGLGEGLRQPPQDVVVEDVGADERDHDGDDRDDQARAKLVEVLDERDAVLVLQTTREPRHGRVLGVLALRLRLRLSRRLSGRSLRHGRGRRSGGDFLRLRLARGDRVLELPHAASQGASHLRQALGSEEQEQHDEDDDYLRPSQGTHASMVARCLQRGHQG